MALHSFGLAGASAMMDDQKSLIHANPLEADGTTPATVPTGEVPVYTIAPGTAATLDPTVDPTGLTCAIIGVKGNAGGVEVVTVTANKPDGTPATGTLSVTMTQDPAELGLNQFGPTMDTPVAQ